MRPQTVAEEHELTEAQYESFREAGRLKLAGVFDGDGIEGPEGETVRILDKYVTSAGSGFLEERSTTRRRPTASRSRPPTSK